MDTIQSLSWQTTAWFLTGQSHFSVHCIHFRACFHCFFFCVCVSLPSSGYAMSTASFSSDYVTWWRGFDWCCLGSLISFWWHWSVCSCFAVIIRVFASTLRLLLFAWHLGNNNEKIAAVLAHGVVRRLVDLISHPSTNGLPYFFLSSFLHSFIHCVQSICIDYSTLISLLVFLSVQFELLPWEL